MSNDGLLIADLDSKFDAVIEILQDVQKNMATKDELAEVKADVKVIKAAVNDHETRITNLETA
ncbi:MAG TPA: hypothetical protein VD947_00230 [Patescibacteria group bacterium]|nr:hypothetical protein [Patescibacteria group bacterium]